jgi:hypothetical protein
MTLNLLQTVDAPEKPMDPTAPWWPREEPLAPPTEPDVPYEAPPADDEPDDDEDDD